jgi:hypothetical protein
LSANRGSLGGGDLLVPTSHGINGLKKYLVTPGAKNFKPEFFVD